MMVECLLRMFLSDEEKVVFSIDTKCNLVIIEELEET